MMLDTMELRGDRRFVESQRVGQRRLEVANLRDVRQAIAHCREPRALRDRKQQLAVKMRARIAGDRHVRQIARVEAAVLQAVADGGRRESGLVLQPAETLFLHRARQAGAGEERGTGIAVVRVHPENVHGVLGLRTRAVTGSTSPRRCRRSRSSLLMSTKNLEENPCRH